MSFECTGDDDGDRRMVQEVGCCANKISRRGKRVYCSNWGLGAGSILRMLLASGHGLSSNSIWIVWVGFRGVTVACDSPLNVIRLGVLERRRGREACQKNCYD